jgi:protein-arginine kinase
MPMLGREKEMTQVDVAACAKAERRVRRRMIWNSGAEICDRVFVSAGLLRGVEHMFTS